MIQTRLERSILRWLVLSAMRLQRCETLGFQKQLLPLHNICLLGNSEKQLDSTINKIKL